MSFKKIPTDFSGLKSIRTQGRREDKYLKKERDLKEADDAYTLCNDKETVRQRDKETERQRDRETERQRDREMMHIPSVT